ncbi:homocysteine S-methyltransferase family protein [Planctomycetota bacterium]
MAKVILKNRLQDKAALLLDGGMGSQLIARNVQATRNNEYLNIEAPEVIQAIHQDYLNAGSDVLVTNTFGASVLPLRKYELDGQCERLNTVAASLAREVAGSEHYVLGDLGPCGDFLEPLGTVSTKQLYESFRVQTEGLMNGGIDGFIVETMTALDEISIAVEAAQSTGSDLPIFASLAFDFTPNGFKTMMGVDVATAISRLISLGIDAIGFNCGTATLEQYVALGTDYCQVLEQLDRRIALYAEPNAGKPEVVKGEVVYSATPELYAESLEQLYQGGITILGGCCGTTPAHIAAAADRLKTA